MAAIQAPSNNRSELELDKKITITNNISDKISKKLNAAISSGSKWVFYADDQVSNLRIFEHKVAKEFEGNNVQVVCADRGYKLILVIIFVISKILEDKQLPPEEISKRIIVVLDEEMPTFTGTKTAEIIRNLNINEILNWDNLDKNSSEIIRNLNINEILKFETIIEICRELIIYSYSNNQILHERNKSLSSNSLQSSPAASPAATPSNSKSSSPELSPALTPQNTDLQASESTNQRSLREFFGKRLDNAKKRKSFRAFFGIGSNSLQLSPAASPAVTPSNSKPSSPVESPLSSRSPSISYCNSGPFTDSYQKGTPGGISKLVSEIARLFDLSIRERANLNPNHG